MNIDGQDACDLAEDVPSGKDYYAQLYRRIDSLPTNRNKAMKTDNALEHIDREIRRNKEFGATSRVTLVRRASGTWRATLVSTFKDRQSRIIGSGVTPGAALSALADQL